MRLPVWVWIHLGFTAAVLVGVGASMTRAVQAGHRKTALLIAACAATACASAALGITGRSVAAAIASVVLFVLVVLLLVGASVNARRTRAAVVAAHRRATNPGSNGYQAHRRAFPGRAPTAARAVRRWLRRHRSNPPTRGGLGE